MVASRSDTDPTVFDRFHCLQCDTIIRFDQSDAADVVRSRASEPNA